MLGETETTEETADEQTTAAGGAGGSELVETIDFGEEAETADAADPDRDDRLPRGYADVVVGGQAGSEGKGAVVAHLLRTGNYGSAVRPGSTNAGHSVYGLTKKAREAGDAPGVVVPEDDRWDKYVHQVLPSAATVTGGVDLMMAPESSFGLDEFFEEAQDMADRWGEDALDRVYVDPKAAIITDHHRKLERERGLGRDIGSTVHGCGAVRVEKIWRSAGHVRLAEDYEALDRFTRGTRRVPERLRERARNGEKTIIEGTQGTLLSMNQSDFWPYTTSRDCTASAFISSVGLPPSAVRDVWAVFRTYPIRVGGNSGPMDAEEISFETIGRRAGFEEPPVEFTSVTGKKRRIFEWSWHDFGEALRLNDPDYVAITFADYIDADNRGASDWRGLTADTRGFVKQVDHRAQKICGAQVALVKTGPMPGDIVDSRDALDEHRKAQAGRTG